MLSEYLIRRDIFVRERSRKTLKMPFGKNQKKKKKFIQQEKNGKTKNFDV